MIQLWVNLPSKYKMTKPKYQPISKEDIATYKLDNDGGEIRVIAGEVKGVKGPADTFSKINIYNVDMRNNARVSLNEPSNFNTGMLIISGEIKINDESVYKENDFILFDNVEGDIILESVSENSLAIVLSGEPLNEPVIAHGPFVMNTKQEIMEAYEDYNLGKFGTFNF